MSWADYCLNDPTFCKPIIVAEGLVRALFERHRASYIVRYGSDLEMTLDDYRNRFFPNMFTRTDRLSSSNFCRNFDGYLAMFAWTNANVLDCPIANYFGPMGPCTRTCQYYPWYGQEDNCPGYQSIFVDENGKFYTLRSLLDDIGDKELIDAGYLDINQPSLYVPWAVQRVKMLKKLRRYKDTSPGITLTTEECDWSESIYDNPYSTRQAAVDAVPREIVTEPYYTNSSMFCFTRMYDGVCTDVELRLPVSAAPSYEEDLLDELKPRSGYLVINAADLNGEFNPFSAPVTKGLNTFQLQEDGTFFSNWPTRIAVPDCPDEDYLTIGWEMQRKYAVYDFNSTFEFQE